MVMTGSQCRAARALIEWSRDQLSAESGVAVQEISDFESGRVFPNEESCQSIRRALEEAGAVFLEEGAEGGVGVRLKYSRREVRALNKWEGEGGQAADDDVYPA
ncbi:helix-turn-helix transcriptional regulator [Pusillimonas sp. CC-YST705]|uniref:Helix-turn-helix transcriptional regulator n=2 Tax=Mesopusillimonas faecipullorum TaxID=2755040 RepID=A0ABS8C958_9BURK|nr:helix-turn-helix transcriptional regulator [Mesopusillimonas faecipullorum]